jgi:hypothetical protein
MRAKQLLVLTLIAGLGSSTVAQADTGSPFVSGSSGPQATARVDVAVTRTVGGVAVTLPGANVPALATGDRVAIRFPDYTGRATRVNYHVNTAFLTEAAPQHWLYDRSGPQDRLFANAKHRGASPPLPEMRFTYGTGDRRGIPIVFIVPEDGKTRGMDGVRDYVEAHPTDFKNMSESANDAVDRYTWFSDFSQSLAQGSLDPVTGQQRVTAIAVSLGASQATVDACYVPGSTQAAEEACLQSALQAVQYQPNVEAPTQAQFLGGIVGAATPLAIATYLQPLLTLWQIFALRGHKEYEYLPTALALATDAGIGTAHQVLAGLKVPTLRPPAAYSDALFFTIGDPQSAARPPVVAADAAAAGFCATAPHVAIPLHLDRTSSFLNATHLVVSAVGKPDRTIPLSPDTLGAPTIDRATLDDGSDAAYTLHLAGRFGFDRLANAADLAAHVAIPRDVPWTLVPAPHRTPTAGGALDVIATSAAAPCLTHAELQVGNAAPMALDAKHLDASHVELTASLASVPPTDAVIRFVQNDPAHGTQIERATTLALAAPPARVDTHTAPSVSLGTRVVELHGSGFDGVAAVRFGPATFEKDSSSTADDACFVGTAPFAPRASAGGTITGTLVGTNGVPGDVFAATIAPARPMLAALGGAPASDALRFSSVADPLALATVDAPIPTKFAVRVRRAPARDEPCDALHADDAAVAVPASATHVTNATHLAVALDAGALLGDGAFGTLQLQLANTRTNLASDWVAIPGTFARSPAIVRIACPTDPSAPCSAYGSALGTIAGVLDAAQAGTPSVVPTLGACPPVDKIACVLVPHRAHYVFRLDDDGASFPVADAAVNAPQPKPAPSASPAG